MKNASFFFFLFIIMRRVLPEKKVYLFLCPPLHYWSTHLQEEKHFVHLSLRPIVNINIQANFYRLFFIIQQQLRSSVFLMAYKLKFTWFKYSISCFYFTLFYSFSLSLSLSLTHTHTHDVHYLNWKKNEVKLSHQRLLALFTIVTCWFGLSIEERHERERERESVSINWGQQ